MEGWKGGKVERNTGNDTSASWATNAQGINDGHWYNEAYSGITVVIYTTEIAINLGSTSERLTVLDPKLAPEISSKSAQNTAAHLLQYKSSLGGLSDTMTIGTFKGTPVKIKNLDLLFTSNKF